MEEYWVLCEYLLSIVQKCFLPHQLGKCMEENYDTGKAKRNRGKIAVVSSYETINVSRSKWT